MNGAADVPPASDGNPRETEGGNMPQCRICLDSDEEMGRLIKPCLCKGSIGYVHVKCLKRWRESSHSAFFTCPQCHYRYNFQRTKVLGIATNPIVIGVATSLFFAMIVLAASFVTTTFTSLLTPESDNYSYGVYSFGALWVNPFSVFFDLVRAAMHMLQDVGGLDIDLDKLSTHVAVNQRKTTQRSRGLLQRVIRRFILGLPVVSAGTLVHMLLTTGLAPVQWLSRYRNRNRRNQRNNSAIDTATVILVVLLLIGALRAIQKVYLWIERLTKQLLLRAEDIILEVV